MPKGCGAGDRGRGCGPGAASTCGAGPFWVGPARIRVEGSPSRPLLGASQIRSSLWRKNSAGSAIPMAAAACGTKAMALFKRTLVLSPAAAPRGPGAGTAPRGCCLPPAAWPCKDWPRGEGGRLWSRLPQSHSHSCSSTSPTAVCLVCPQDSLSSSLKTCYKYLNQTSRSFAAVIQALDGEMR